MQLVEMFHVRCGQRRVTPPLLLLHDPSPLPFKRRVNPSEDREAVSVKEGIGGVGWKREGQAGEDQSVQFGVEGPVGFWRLCVSGCYSLLKSVRERGKAGCADGLTWLRR